MANDGRVDEIMTMHKLHHILGHGRIIVLDMMRRLAMISEVLRVGLLSEAYSGPAYQYLDLLVRIHISPDHGLML